MTKNEYIASIMLEAAYLLKSDDTNSLNEAIFEKQKSSNKNIRKEVNAGLSGKYDDKFIRSEKELAEFLDKYGDQITEIAKATKEDINNSRKFTKGKIATIAVLLIGAITSAVTGGLAVRLSMKKADLDFARKAKEMQDRFEENVKRTSAEYDAKYKENVKKMHNEFNELSREKENAFRNISNRHNKANEIMRDSLKNIAENSKSAAKDSAYIDKKLSEMNKTLNSMLNDSVTYDSLSDNLYDYDSLNESALGITSIVSGLATVLFAIVDGLLRVKDARDINENIKYLKMIKRKLTKDITKIKNPQVRDKYETLIERINRAEDEYTGKVTVSTNG